MRLCKYCNKPIAEKDIWNPDNDGNGYHHQCLVDMEFKARDKQIYDKGKMDVLDKIRAEMGRCKTLHEMQLSERDTKGKLLISDIFCDVVEILDRYRNEVSEE